MAIQDNDPERRNLTVTAMAFIAYYYAGGSFSDSTVTLQVISADFSKPEVLAFLAWAALIWFIYRYWQSHRGTFSGGFSTEFDQWRSKKYIHNYAARQLGKELVEDKEEGYHVRSLHWERGAALITLIYAANVKRNEHGKIQSYSTTGDTKDIKIIPMKGLGGRFLSLRATFECWFEHPSFSQYLVPYILAVLAVLGGIYRECF